DHAGDLAVFDRLESLGIDFVARAPLARGFECRCAQETANMVGAKGWDGALAHWNFSSFFFPPPQRGRSRAKRSRWGSVNSAIALNPENDPHPKPRPSRGRVSSTSPHLLGNLHDHPQFGPLFVLGEDVAFFGRGEAALRRQAQLIQRDIFNRFVDAPL